MNNLLIDIVGWVGVLSLLAAYALVSMKKVQGDSAAYQLMNLAGSALLILNSFHYKAFPSVGVNVAWVGIAVYTMVKRNRAKGEQA
jgi:hypothetical protein